MTVQNTASARVSGRRVGDFFRRPSEAAANQADFAATRVRHRAAPVRVAFIRGTPPASPPMARLLRGGRGGEVRLKLYLTLLWIAVKPPHDATFPARGWAELLGLDDPGGNGARRVTDAAQWLEQAGLVRTERETGKPSRIFLLHDAGTGEPYRPPWDTHERYVKLPEEYWTKGWVVTLSGTALALLLILLERRPTLANGSFWLAPSRAMEYGVSADTWAKASRELVYHGLLVVRRRPVDAEHFGWRRLRNNYYPLYGQLEHGPDAHPVSLVGFE